jgi:hypothetical protein
MDYLNHGKASLSNVFEATYHDVLIGEDMLSVSDSLTAIQSLSLRVTQNETDITAIETDLSTNYYDIETSESIFAHNVHGHSTLDIIDLHSYTGFDSRYYSQQYIDSNYYDMDASDSIYAQNMHSHSTMDIIDLGSYTGFDNYHTKTILGVMLDLKSDADHVHSGYSLVDHTHSGYSLVDHTHSIYASTSYVDSGLSTKASLSHNHDGVYAPLSHSHSDIHALLSHTHLTSHITDLSSYTGFDSRYYTESQSDALFAGITHSHSSLSTSASSYLEINAIFGSYNAGISLVPYSSGTSWHISIDSDGSDFFITDGSTDRLQITSGEVVISTNRMYIQPESGSLVSESGGQLVLYSVADESNACAQNNGGSGEYVNIQLVIAARQHSTSYLTQWAIGLDASNTLSDGDLHFMIKQHSGSWVKRAYLQDSVSVAGLDFTGQHRCKSDDIDTDDHVGLIVITTGKILNLDGSTDPTINESLPEIVLCNTYMDKRVYGVVSDSEDTGQREYEVGALVSVFNKMDGIDRTIINSVGEGAIYVNNTHGDIKNGDLICGDIGGYGTLQSDDIIHSYTVGKATMDAIYTDGKAFIACVYYCG